MNQKNRDLQTLVIDLEELKKNQLNESFLTMFGGYIKLILGRMFGSLGSPITIRGKQSDLQALSSVLAKEKKYMDSFLKNGLNDRSVVSNRHKLEKAVFSFEKETGMKWPIK
jgi:hypothetical protein